MVVNFSRLSTTGEKTDEKKMDEVKASKSFVAAAYLTAAALLNDSASGYM